MPTSSLLVIKYRYFDSYGSFAYKYTLSMSGWFSIKFNNTFVFPDPEPPIYISAWMIWSIWPIFIVFSFIFIYIVTKINHLHFLCCNINSSQS